MGKARDLKERLEKKAVADEPDAAIGTEDVLVLMGRKMARMKALLVAVEQDIIVDDPACECERCGRRRDWLNRYKEEML
jgi:hypothetical protein